MSVVFSFLLMFFTLTSGVSAASSEEVFSLQPLSNSEVVLDEADLVVDGDEVTFSMSQEFGEEEKVSSEYDVEVDTDNLTYSVVERKVENEDNVSLASTVKHLFVTVRTYDPVGIKLNETQGKLWWSPGSTATKVAGSKVCTPSTKPTHWYNNSCITMSDTSMNGGQKYSYGVSSGYHNYDFLSSKKRTDVNHHISLEGNRDGTSKYNATWSKKGEASSLLHFTTGVTKN